MILFEEERKKQECNSIARIKVFGVGGAGGNTVNSLIDSGYQGIECMVANTDAQALEQSKADIKIQLGVKSTKGLGTGANPELGKRAAEEDLEEIIQHLVGSDIVFLAGGMGGGTGSGALPVIASVLREKGILSVAVVTKPFTFEGKKRARVAEQALAELKKYVDTIIVIPNQKLLEVAGKDVSMIDAFALINDILSQSVRGISDIISKSGHINVDFADVRAIMKDMGLAVMGTGRATGANRAQEAAQKAIASPLLENMSVKGARGVLLNITGSRTLGLHEISEAASVIYDQADEDAHIILGSVIDESMGDEISVAIIATGFDSHEEKYEHKDLAYTSSYNTTLSNRTVSSPCDTQKSSLEVKSPVSVPESKPSEIVCAVPAQQEKEIIVQATRKVEEDLEINKNNQKESYAHNGFVLSNTIQHEIKEQEKEQEKKQEYTSNYGALRVIEQEEVTEDIQINNQENVQKVYAQEAQKDTESRDHESVEVDLDNLDVPTFLRKESQNYQHNNQHNNQQNNQHNTQKNNQQLSHQHNNQHNNQKNSQHNSQHNNQNKYQHNNQRNNQQNYQYNNQQKQQGQNGQQGQQAQNGQNGQRDLQD